jgi:type I restriction enzyme S subunit
MKLETIFQNFDQFTDVPTTVAKIRELVLDLGMRGKLSRQDQQEHSMFEQGKPRLAPENTPYMIPDNWTWVTLQDVVSFHNGDRGKNYPSKDLRTTSGVPFINAGHLVDGAISTSNMDFISEEHFGRLNAGKVKRGDVLYCLRGSLGKAAIVQDIDRGAIASSLLILRSFSLVIPKFLYFYIASPLATLMISRYDNGSAQPNLSASNVKKYLFPLPPLSEQERIVAKVDELMALCDRLEAQQKERDAQQLTLSSAAIARFNEYPSPENLNFLFHTSYSISPADLRKTILNLAVQGKLSPQDPADESTIDLVRRIEEARSQVRARSYPAITPSDFPFEIPASWSWVRLGNIALSSDSGWSPQCDPEAREGDAWGVLKVSAVSWGKFLPEENKALPLDLSAREECEVKAGDFLLSRANTEDLVARSVVVIDTPPHLMMSDKIVRFSFPNLIDKSFINLVNSASFAREHYSRNASGTSSSMKNIGREVMCNLPVPLPPLAEQCRIVAKTETLFRLLERMEEKISSSRSMADGILDGIVSELVTGRGE